MTEFFSLKCKHLHAVVFDWAGTLVDHGCRGPVQVFVESFAALGVAVTEEEARGPMGMGKFDHVLAMLALPRVREVWTAVHHAPPDHAAAKAVYARVESGMLDAILHYSSPIAGVRQSIEVMRAAGLRIGSCTGYPRPVAERMAAKAALEGLVPDCLLSATDVSHARPAPDMCLAILRGFGIDDPRRAVKIGDTANDVLEGKNAGMWTIGITLTGSLTGLSEEAVAALSPHQRETAAARAKNELTEAGADFLAPDIPACLPLLARIDVLLGTG